MAGAQTLSPAPVLSSASDPLAAYADIIAAADQDRLSPFKLALDMPSRRFVAGDRINPNVAVRGMRDQIAYCTTILETARKLAEEGKPAPVTDYWPRITEETLARESADLAALNDQMQSVGLVPPMAMEAAERTGPHIYTCGYAGKTVDQLFQTAKRLKAQVVDIRLNPWSQVPEWRREELQRVFGPRYESVPALGNAQRKNPSAPDLLADWPEGLTRIRFWMEHMERSPILLCQCWDAKTCHRSEIVKRLDAEGLASQELDWLMKGETA